MRPTYHRRSNHPYWKHIVDHRVRTDVSLKHADNNSGNEIGWLVVTLAAFALSNGKRERRGACGIGIRSVTAVTVRAGRRICRCHVGRVPCCMACECVSIGATSVLQRYGFDCRGARQRRPHPAGVLGHLASRGGRADRAFTAVGWSSFCTARCGSCPRPARQHRSHSERRPRQRLRSCHPGGPGLDVDTEAEHPGVRHRAGRRTHDRRQAERATTIDLLIIRSAYRQPFGTFHGTLPGGLRVQEGYGVMEDHRVLW